MTTTEAPPLDGMEAYYGMWVTSVGDDGDLLVAGHHPLMRAVAAMNCYSRRVIRLVNVADDRSATLADIAPGIEQRWATRATHADCASRTSPTYSTETRGTTVTDTAAREGEDPMNSGDERPKPWTIYRTDKHWWQNPYTITGPGGNVVGVAMFLLGARQVMRRVQRRKAELEFWKGGEVMPTQPAKRGRTR